MLHYCMKDFNVFHKLFKYAINTSISKTSRVYYDINEILNLLHMTQFIKLSPDNAIKF